jgi:hypothetical protein
MQQKKSPQSNPENPANTGGKERVPGYPQDKNPAGTPNPPKEEFPGEPPKVYAQQGQQQPKGGHNPDTNQPPRRDQDPRQARRSGQVSGERRESDDDPSRRRPDDPQERGREPGKRR